MPLINLIPPKIMRLPKQSVCLLFLCCLFSGCVSTKDITYFQPLAPETDAITTKMKEAYTPVIKPGDILSITVSGLDRENSEMFNPMTLMPATAHTSQSAGIIMPQPITGFTVDSEGNITLPLLGKMNVTGLTSREVEIKLTEHLQQQYLKSPTISVHIANYIVSVLGEVARPAQYVIPHERITMPEVMALAGDLTIYGKRKNVLVIRETDGQRTFARLDLTKRDVFESPYYYLRSGDIVYVEPTKGKMTSTDRTYQLTPVIISSISFLIMILNLFIK